MQCWIWTNLYGFQSTLPMKGATHVSVLHYLATIVSIHAPNEGSDIWSMRITRSGNVSIHAPNEGSDRNIWVKKFPYCQILVLLFLFYL